MRWVSFERCFVEFTKNGKRVWTRISRTKLKKSRTNRYGANVKSNSFDVFSAMLEKHYGSIVARMRLTPADEASSFIIRNFPISWVCVTCGPPQNSREKTSFSSLEAKV